MAYQTARANPATNMAYGTLDNYFVKGREDGMKLFEAIKQITIVDYMVYTKDMFFAPSTVAHGPPKYIVKIKESGVERLEEFTLHPHALRQMAAQVSIPTTFVHTLLQGEPWEEEELSTLLTERFNLLDFKQRGGGGDRFMNRVVGRQVRGFVSRMYKRHISSGAILEAFVRACSRFGAMPANALVTDLSFTLRCFLPHVFEPSNGEFVAIGCSCSNSDFGAGMLRLGLCVLRAKNGTVSYVKDTHAERHLGKADNTADDSVELSPDTIKKQVLAKQGEVEDIVAATLHPDKVNEFLKTIADAMDKKISWYRLERFLQGKLNKQEMEELQALLERGDASGMLPPVSHEVDGTAIANLWWASSAIGQMAQRQPDDARRGDLQDVAGALLLQ